MWLSEASLGSLSAILKPILLVAIVWTFPCPGVAQLVATRDLTSSPSKPQSAQESATSRAAGHNDDCRDSGIGIRDGVAKRDAPDELQLEILNVEPNLIYEGSTITVTVRLLNAGTQPLLVPWDAPPVEPDIDPKTGIETREVAMIGLKLTKGDDHQKFRILKTEGNLAATPSNRVQHVAVRTGEWIDIKFKATIECFSQESWACHTLPRDGQSHLLARWSEEFSTHEVEGCNTWSGHYALDAAESPPFDIVYLSSPETEGAGGVNH
jgi:hypothetical protein